MAVHGFGCLPQITDLRDYVLKSSVVREADLPETYEVSYIHNIKNQGKVSSCSAHAVAEVLEYINPGHKMSTNFIYGTKKMLYGSEGEGMSLRNACKTVAKYGDMVEIDCKGNTEVDKVYSIAEKAFNDKIKLNYAYRFKVKEYVNLKSDEDIKYFIYRYGPVIASIDWYTDYKYNKEEKTIDRTDFSNKDYNKHAIVIYGWDEEAWLCQNSWGVKWGNQGLFRLRYIHGHNEVYGLIDDVNLDSDSVVVNPTYESSFIEVILKFLNLIIAKFKK